MYFVEEYEHLVQQAGLELFKYLEKTFWTPWELQQQGLVIKELWVQPTTEEDPLIVKSIVTWYGVDFATAVNPMEVQQINDEVESAMVAAGFVFQFVKKNSWFSLTIIDDGMADTDNDQDDNDDVGGNTPNGLDQNGYVMPDDDTDSSQLMEMDMEMEPKKDMEIEMKYE
jgi:hypothetical protein